MTTAIRLAGPAQQHRRADGAPAVPALVGSAKAAVTTSPLTIAVPAGVSPGDLLVWVSCHRNSGIATVPAGFTQVIYVDTSNGNDFTYVGYKVADGTEGSSLAAVLNGSQDGAGILAAFSGVGALVASAWADDADATPSVTATAGGLVLHIGSNVFSDTGGAWTGWDGGAPPTLVDIAWDYTPDHGVILGYEAGPAVPAGATPSYTPTGTDKNDDGCATLAFAPAS